MILLDPDAVEPTNLNRLIGANAMSVGRPKVDIAAEHVSRIRPSIQSNAVNGSILSGHDGKALLEADLLFGCTDSHGSRAVLNQIAYQYMIPTIDLGIIINVVDFKVRSVTGRVQMLAPGLPCLVCQNLLNPEQVRRDFLSPKERALDPYIVGLPRPEPQPSVVSLNGTMASLGVTMMLAAVTGLPSPARHQVFIGERGIVRAVASSPLEDCVVCSRSGALGRGDLWPMMWRPG
jgi:molybdopterin/thiamine biosynthesis adenylyltransferase